MTRFTILLLTLLLMACASTPEPQIHSYFLEIENDAKPGAVTIGIIDVKVQMARYLAQPGIVLQTGPNQLTAAHYHRWAEPLTEGIRRVLAGKVNVNRTLGDAQGSGMTLSMEFYRFHGTHDGNALVAGHWSIFDGQKQQPLYQQSFDLKQPLPQAGYEALVQTLSALLDTVGRDIMTYLAKQ